MKKIFMSILACGLLTIGLCGCGPSNTPEDVAEAAAKAMISNDFDKFVDYVYVKEGTSEEEENRARNSCRPCSRLKQATKSQNILTARSLTVSSMMVATGQRLKWNSPSKTVQPRPIRCLSEKARMASGALSCTKRFWRVCRTHS